MATFEIDAPVATKPDRSARRAGGMNPLQMLFSPLASLKLTLVLLGMSVFLIFAGTLAQAQAGMWEAISHYFSSWNAWVQVQIFLPKPWFPELHDYLGADKTHSVYVPLLGDCRFLPYFPWVFAFPFPGGATIGVAMMINLLAAHTVRFRSQARGLRLWAGVPVLVAGVVFTYAVIAMGDFHQGLRDRPLMSWEATALLTLLGAIAATCALGGAAFWFGSAAWSTGEKRRWVQMALSVTGALVSALGCGLLIAFFNDMSALRILWQLIQGTMAGVVLLGGCWLVFDKRAGIVLLHGGIALMMLSQLFVSLWAVEERLTVEEGDTSVYAADIRVSELAMVETTETSEKHVVIPQPLLEQAAASKTDRILSHPDLPFDVEVLEFYKNSSLDNPPEKKAENPANKGLGLEFLAVPRPVGAGASSDAGVDMPSTYVSLRDKKTGKSLGTYLATTQLNEDHVEVGDKSFQFSLRFKREYKPYSVTLKDAKRENYPGSNKPKNYESTVQFVDPSHNVDRPVKISMNNPFRYLGETFYQSGMDVNRGNGKEYSVFQVVTNAGWMTPYVACMIVAVGLIYQFVQTLMKFILADPGEAFRGAMMVATAASVVAGVHVINAPGPRIETPPQAKRSKRKEATPTPVAGESWWRWFVPGPVAIGAIVLSLLVVGIGFVKPRPKAQGFNLYEFGKLPVVDQGRTKPFDSLANETLLALSNKTSVSDADKKSYSAIQWLLMTIAQPEQAEKLHVIRIEHPDVIAALDLPEDRKSMRFSLAELKNPKATAELQKQLGQLNDKKPDEYTAYENKLAELGRRLQAHSRVKNAFTPLPLKLPSRKALLSEDPEAQQQAMQAVELMEHFGREVESLNPPLAVPVTNSGLEAIARERKWVPFAVASMFAQFAEIMPADRVELDQSTAELRDIFAAFAQDKPADFNAHVESYQAWLTRKEPAMYSPNKVSAESYLNHYAPFGWTAGIPLYLLAFLLSAVGLLVFRRELGKAAFWMLVIAFVLHGAALCVRIYISGRPPVTNLYSSAVFIGLAAVFMGLILEGWFRLGVGNLIAAMAGLASLLIANQLSLSERDTIGVMEAVLDTQFWLATHVVCITLGYASTFVAGLLGIAYIFVGLFTPNLNARDSKLLGRMIYGVVCFALLFSFVGTVLGGLWADDSWGRFWGWDPKENGALIIVLWNAFILHAKWDKLANERGLAVLAVFGNIVTSWSWFGTNLLGVGLHSYGFSKEIGMALVATVVTHLAIIGLGLLPKAIWRSHQEQLTQSQFEATQVVG